MTPEALAAFEQTLPSALTPAGNYVPVVQVGRLLFTAGTLPLRDGQPAFTGLVTTDPASLERGREAAKLSALNVLSIVKAHLGSLRRVARVVKLTGFVNCEPGFTQQAAVMNGASDLMVEVFGDRGRHVRTSLGAGALPRNASIEIEAVFEVLDA